MAYRKHKDRGDSTRDAGFDPQPRCFLAPAPDGHLFRPTSTKGKDEHAGLVISSSKSFSPPNRYHCTVFTAMLEYLAEPQTGFLCMRPRYTKQTKPVHWRPFLPMASIANLHPPSRITVHALLHLALLQRAKTSALQVSTEWIWPQVQKALWDSSSAYQLRCSLAGATGALTYYVYHSR